MANSRMFHKSIVRSAKFLTLPVKARELYFQLGMDADDDGIVEAFTVMRTVGAAQKDLKALEASGLVKILNENLVTYITDWLSNNTIRPSRKTDSYYQELLLSVVPDAELVLSTKNNKKPTNGGIMSDKCPTSDSPVFDKEPTNDGLDKISRDKTSGDESNIKDICPVMNESPPDLSGILLPLVDKTEYDVPLGKIKKWKEAYPAVDIEQELKKMGSWLDANSQRRKTRRGIERFIISWLSREQDNGGTYRNNLQERRMTSNAGERKYNDKSKYGDL